MRVAGVGRTFSGIVDTVTGMSRSGTVYDVRNSKGQVRTFQEHELCLAPHRTSPQIPLEDQLFEEGQQVHKVGGDYTFSGTAVAVFRKTSGKVRLVVEDDRGCLHIFSQNQVQTGP